MRLPRRLAHGETAEFVDHLGEPRARLIASLAALAATSSVAYVFHERIVE